MVNVGEELPINRMKRVTKPDGVTVLIDTGVRKTKKNRHRHCKDGTPKKLRGTAVTRLYDCSGQNVYELSAINSHEDHPID